MNMYRSINCEHKLAYSPTTIQTYENNNNKKRKSIIRNTWNNVKNEK